MIEDKDLEPITPTGIAASPSAEHVSSGVPIPKTLRVSIFSPDDWEAFIQEWADSLKDSYHRVARFGGSGDLGLDVIGFASDKVWNGDWDNYQCKRYDHPLSPSDIWVEIGKIVYYSYKKEYTIPRKYYFVAPQDIGTSLQKLLAQPEKLKEKAKVNWDNYCKAGITSTTEIPLGGELLEWFDKFDFTIFSSKSIVELIAGHAKTPFHSVRFGGGLPPRPEV